MSPDSEYSSEGPRGPSEPPDGWCGREAPGWRAGRCNMSRFLRLKALETLARCGTGAVPPPWRERRARGRACRGGSGRTRRGGAVPPPWRERRARAHAAGPWQPRTHGGHIPRYTVPNTPRHTASQRAAYILGYTTQPIGRNHRRVQRAAFLVAEGRSQRSRAAVRGTPAPMARAAGAGTRLPRRKRAHAAGPWQPRPHGGHIPRYTVPNTPRHAIPHHNAPHISWDIPRNPSAETAAACPKPRFSHPLDTRNAHARRARCSPAPMARAAGAGTRLPRRARAHAAGPWQPRTHGGHIPRYTVPNTPRRITTRRIYPRIYHATHRQKPPPPAPSRVSCVLRTLATLTAAPRRSPVRRRKRPMPQRAKGGDGTRP